MKVIHYPSFATIFIISVCLAQVDIPSLETILPGEIQSIAETFAQSAVSDAVQTAIAPSTTLTPQESSSSTDPTTSSPQTSPITSTSSSASVTTSTPTSTSTPISSTTSTSTSSSSTTSGAKPSSSIASSGLKPSAKIGIGLGLPFGVIALAMIGFLTMRHIKHKEDSRLRHHGIIAAAGLYPVIDEADNAGEGDARNMIHVDNSNDPQGLEKADVHEIQGTEIPPYTRELVGSPTVGRSHFPFSPESV